MHDLNLLWKKSPPLQRLRTYEPSITPRRPLRADSDTRTEIPAQADGPGEPAIEIPTCKSVSAGAVSATAETTNLLKIRPPCAHTEERDHLLDEWLELQDVSEAPGSSHGPVPSGACRANA